MSTATVYALFQEFETADQRAVNRGVARSLDPRSHASPIRIAKCSLQHAVISGLLVYFQSQIAL